MARRIRLDNPVLAFSPDDQSTLHQLRGRSFEDARGHHTPLITDCHAAVATKQPEVDADFLGFHLCAELGQGGIARVFLACQSDLADRPVVVKVARDLWGEANALAQLHHPNIVPVYSVHYRETFQAFCMPYRGLTTFQDVLGALQKMPSLPTSGQFFSQVIKNTQEETTFQSKQAGFLAALHRPEEVAPDALDANLSGTHVCGS